MKEGVVGLEIDGEVSQSGQIKVKLCGLMGEKWVR